MAVIRRWVESQKGVEGSVGRCAVRLCLAVLCLAKGSRCAVRGVFGGGDGRARVKVRFRV